MAIMEGIPVPAEMVNTATQAQWAISVNSDESVLADQPLMSTPDAKLLEPSSCFDSWAAESHINPPENYLNHDSMQAEDGESWAHNASPELCSNSTNDGLAELGPLQLVTQPQGGIPDQSHDAVSEATFATAASEAKSRKGKTRKTASRKALSTPTTKTAHHLEAALAGPWVPNTALFPSHFIPHAAFPPSHVPHAPNALNHGAVNTAMPLWVEPVPERRFSESDQESTSNGQSSQRRGAHVRHRPEMQKNARDGQKHWARKVQELRRVWIDRRIWEKHANFRQQIAMCKRCHIKSQHECLLRQLQVAHADGLLSYVHFSENSEDSFLGWIKFQVKPERSQEFRLRIESMFPGSPSKNTVNNVLRRAALLPEHSWSGAWNGESAFNHSESHRTETPTAAAISGDAPDLAGPLAAIAAGTPAETFPSPHQPADLASSPNDDLLSLTDTPADGL